MGYVNDIANAKAGDVVMCTRTSSVLKDMVYGKSYTLIKATEHCIQYIDNNGVKQERTKCNFVFLSTHREKQLNALLCQE